MHVIVIWLSTPRVFDIGSKRENLNSLVFSQTKSEALEGYLFLNFSLLLMDYLLLDLKNNDQGRYSLEGGNKLT